MDSIKKGDSFQQEQPSKIWLCVMVLYFISLDPSLRSHQSTSRKSLPPLYCTLLLRAPKQGARHTGRTHPYPPRNRHALAALTRGAACRPGHRASPKPRHPRYRIPRPPRSALAPALRLHAHLPTPIPRASIVREARWARRARSLLQPVPITLAHCYGGDPPNTCYTAGALPIRA